MTVRVEAAGINPIDHKRFGGRMGADPASLPMRLGGEIAGVVTAVARQVSRRDGTEWGKITIEDFHGTATVLAFKDAWQASKEKLRQDAVVLIRGAVSNRERDEEDPPLFLDEVQLLEELQYSGQLAVRIELEPGVELPEEAFARAKSVLAAHPGAAPVEVTLGKDNGVEAPRLRSRTLRVNPTREAIHSLQEVFGKAHVRLVREKVWRGGEQPAAPPYRRTFAPS